MRELRSCDFCGGDAAGIFEVLPPKFTPAPDQRRVILCADCQETLTSVIEPLMTRLGVSDGDAPAPDVTPEPTAGPPESAGSQAGGAASVEVDAVEPAPEPEQESVSESLTEKSPTEDPLSEPESTETVEVGVESEGELASEEVVESDEEEDNETVDTADTGADEPANSTANGDELRPEPPKFRQVIRILQNREFPVDRNDVEDLAANAYSLEDDEVRDIFEYAIERGLLEETNGQLRKV
ncbi:hypothetical protein [Haloferax sp. DFSO60]|uniref:hypothetical protein n=1 Tax=Haloferax sp. DFSO60 TaxID=3388652 RepID=UPI003979CD96